VILKERHIEFERKCGEIIGRTIKKVLYEEIKYDFGNNEVVTPYYKTRFPNVDTIDFAIIFQSDTDFIEIKWDTTFFQYGVTVERVNDFNPEERYGRIWEVSVNGLWKPNLYCTIIDVSIQWEEVWHTSDGDIIAYPQAILLYLSNNRRLIISAAEFLSADNEEAMGFLDNLLVTDDEELAKQIKMI
jgi:hypothetical protein